jgi:hypothetical protein
MKRLQATATAVCVVALALAAVARGAEEPTRESYVATVEPICERDRDAAQKILGGTKEAINDGRLDAAGRQLVRASQRFAGTIRQLVVVPRPPADEARLQKWFKFLRIVRDRIRQTGVYYKQGKRLQATHESIAVERSGNAANNVSFPFKFRYCRLSRSRLG